MKLSIRQIEPFFWYSDGTDEYQKGFYYRYLDELYGPFESLSEAKEKFSVIKEYN